MRKPRKKVIDRDCYYHCYSRTPGRKDDEVFSASDRAEGMRLLEELSRYYLVEVISAAWMFNDMYIVCFAPAEIPELAQVQDRHNAFWEEWNKQYPPSIHKPLLDFAEDPDACKDAAADMIDVSHFMRVLRQRFSMYYNKTHQRCGALWDGRFRSTVLDIKQAVWNCVKYVELSPVRLCQVDEPADYPFSTWGSLRGMGRHLFRGNFARHMRASVSWTDASDWGDDFVIDEFRRDLAKTMVSERRAQAEEAAKKSEREEERKDGKRAPRKDSMQLKFLSKTRHWTDGDIIGSKEFVREMACLFEDPTRTMKKHLSRGRPAEGGTLYCFKRLQVDK